MACSDTPRRRNAAHDGPSRPPVNPRNAITGPELPPAQSSTPLLVLIGRLTFLGFLLAWGLALLQGVQ